MKLSKNSKYVVAQIWYLVVSHTSSSIIGARLWAEEILRVKSRCLAISQLLCDVMFSFIKENSCSHRNVLPNSYRLSSSETQLGNCAGELTGTLRSTTAAYFALSASLRLRSTNSIQRFLVSFPFPFMYFVLQSQQIGVWSQQYTNFISKPCAREHTCRELFSGTLSIAAAIVVIQLL